MSFTAIALSGGVDSLTTAYLLKKAGHRLVGIHFLTGFETVPPLAPDTPFGALQENARRRLAPISDRLAIPLEIVDARRPFQQIVIDYFKTAYQTGCTPNPCMVCNPAIKFGWLMAQARQLGADHLATGHYARVAPDTQGRHHLLCGVDARKDQSYFLARLTQEQLAAAVFPLGDRVKTDVQTRAADLGLHPVTQGESQDICFIHNQTYGEFLQTHLGLKPKEGPIATLGGQVIGRHQGLHRFTIGQRRGINCPGPEPYYVVRLEPNTNTLVVGAKRDLKRSGCLLAEMNWIQPKPEGPFSALIRIRYRHKAVPATITPLAKGRAKVQFDTPQAAITPGQGGVIYQGDEVWGGGWIAKEDSLKG